MTLAAIWTAGILLAAAAFFLLYWGSLVLLFRNRERADETHTILTEDGWELKVFRYLPRAEGRGEPVLFLHGAFANHHNFDIPAQNSMADYLANRGYDCWLLDFRGDRTSTSPEGKRRSKATLDEYLVEDIPAAIDYILAETGYAQLHGVGHSMGGMLWYAYDLEFEGYGVASLNILGAPVDFEHMLDQRRPLMGLALLIITYMPWFARMVQRMFLHALTILRQSTRDFPINWDNAPDEMRMHEVLNSIDLLPGPATRSLLNWTVTNQWTMLDGEMNVLDELSDIHAPLLAVFARRDSLTPPGSAQHFFDKVDNPDKKLLFLSVEDGHESDYDHIDMVFGRHAEEEVFQPILEWIEIHPAIAGPPILAEPVPEEAQIEEAEPVVKESEAVIETRDDELEDEEAATRAEAVGGEEYLDIDEIQRVRHGKVLNNLRNVLGDEDEDLHLDPEGEGLPGTSVSAAKEDASTKSASSKSKSKAASKKKSGTKKKTATSKKKTAAKKKSPAKKKTAKKEKSPAKKKTAKKEKSNTKKKSSATKISGKKKASGKKTASKKKSSAKKKSTKKSAAKKKTSAKSKKKKSSS